MYQKVTFVTFTAVVVARDIGPGIGTPPKGTSKAAGVGRGTAPGGGADEPATATFLSASELASRLQGFRSHVWAQLLRLDGGAVPPRPVEIPEDLFDTYR